MSTSKAWLPTEPNILSHPSPGMPPSQTAMPAQYNQLPLQDNAPITDEHSQKKSRTRIYVSEADKLLLAQLCVKWQDKYEEMRKGDFWGLIRLDFERIASMYIT
jgi:hypothetical protein